MDIWRTNSDTLETVELEKFISKHLAECAPRFSKLWRYYEGKNCKVLSKPEPKEGNPDNRTPVAYGRKIITTFEGYAYRPRYITYSAGPGSEDYVSTLNEVFNANNEHIKTSRAGRNTGIFGEAYEIVYADESGKPRFFSVDPRECFILYDYSPEPKKKIGVRYYLTSDDVYRVEVYYATRVDTFERRVENGKVSYTALEPMPNPIGEVPIVPYYFGDDRLGLIEPVLALIDDYDMLVSDSFVEFDRFANAYLRIVGSSITGGVSDDANGNKVAMFLRRLRERRIFSGLSAPDDVTFLTKDIPKEFIEFMSNLIRQQIHVQSHVPDFTSEQFASGVSGAAIDRLLFDFENVCSSAEADFDTGLLERIRLINIILKVDRVDSEGKTVVINHKRNLPANTKEAAEIAVLLKNAGFSSRLVAESMPDYIVSDVDEELAEQEAELSKIPNLDGSI